MKQGIAFVIGEVIVVICLVWLAFFYFSDPSRKPIVACAPLYYAAGTGTRVATAAVVDTNQTINQSLPQKITLGCLKYVDRLVRSYSDTK